MKTLASEFRAELEACRPDNGDLLDWMDAMRSILKPVINDRFADQDNRTKFDLLHNAMKDVVRGVLA